MTEAAQGAAEILLGLFKAVKDAVKAYLPFSWSILQCQVSFINVTAERLDSKINSRSFLLLPDSETYSVSLFVAR